MASLRRLSNVRKSALFYQSIRNHWNKDFKPGPYPRTPEEREAAAKKYGLLPEEYQVKIWSTFVPSRFHH
jgi:NADH dehydrogenase (ubiquinone) 1 beta subcomplex subunit 8